MEIFWKRGYEGASLPELTRAMGINRPSLYAAFGNKEKLFKRVLDRYAQGPARCLKEALNAPPARRSVERLLAGTIDVVAGSKNPRGCLMVQSALSCGEESDHVRKEVTARRESVVAQLRLRFQKAKKQGDLSADVNVAALARYIATVMHGLAVEATGGASRKDMQHVADLAMRAWPE